jgi:hypothetical protein
MNQLSIPVSAEIQNSPSTPPPSIRKALLIVGVSRSGTSVLSHLLHALGATVPKALMGPGYGNPKGHWEPKALVALNDEILASMGMSWSDPRTIPWSWFSSRPAYDYLLRITRQVQSDYGTEPLIVLKDPRVARLMPLYLAALDVLDIEPLVILSVRSPAEVIASLVNRDGMSAELAEALWLRGVVEAEYESRDCLRCWLSFESLLQDWEVAAAKLAADFGLIWPNPPKQILNEVDRIVKPRFRHRLAPEDHPALSGIVMQAWDAAEQGMRGQETSARHKFDDVRMFLRDLDRLSLSMIATAKQEAQDTLMASIRRSLSWKVTSPLRRAERMIGRSTPIARQI